MVTVSNRQWLLYLSLSCILALSLLLFGCSTKEEPVPTAPSEQDNISSYVPESDPTIVMNDFLAAGADVRGSMKINAVKPFMVRPITTTVLPARISTATASFFDANRHSVDVGQVKLDTIILKKIEGRGRFGAKFYFYTTDPRTQKVDPVTADRWYIDGTPGQFEIPASKVASDLEITAPTNNSKIPTSEDLTITWTGTSTDNTIIIHVTRLMRPISILRSPNPFFIFLRVDDTGSYTIPATKLTRFKSGDKLLVTVTRVKMDKRDVTDFGKVLTSASVQDNVLVTVE